MALTSAKIAQAISEMSRKIEKKTRGKSIDAFEATTSIEF